MVEGSCLCGDIRFAVDSDIEDLEYCHCSKCRKATGSAFGAFGFVPADRFRWKSGHELVRGYASSHDVERTFCTRCGATLQWKHASRPDRFGIALGLVDGSPSIRPKAHIFLGSKAPWFELDEGIPRYDEEPPEDQI